MKIKESRTSRFNQFVALVKAHCPDIRVDDGDDAGHCVFLKSGPADSPTRLKLRIDRVPSGQLFPEGEWCDIELLVRDNDYFDCAQKIGEGYEKDVPKVGHYH